MATISSVDSANKFQVTLEVTETGTSNADNTSTISWSFYITSLGRGGFSGYSIPRTATINGIQVVNSSSSTQCLNNQTTSWGTGTQIITHNNDGTKTISISFSAQGLGDYSWSGTISSSGSVTLTNIPRASTFTLSPSSVSITGSNIGSSNLTCSVTSKASYYHELSYKFESGSSIIVWDHEQVTVASSPETANISYSAIASAMGAASTGVLTVYLKTYTTSSKTTQVGSTQSKTCNVTLSTSSVKPTVVINSITTTTNESPIASYLVAGYSKARINYTVTLPTGVSAASTTFTIKVSNETIATLSSNTVSGTAITGILPSSTSNYTISVTAVSTDARGAVSDVSAAKTKTVYSYAAPKITASFYRVAASGDTEQDSSGEYIYWTFSATQTHTVNSQNSISSVTAKKNSVTVNDNPGWASLSVGSTATLVVIAEDNVTSVSKTYKIGAAVFALDLYDDNAGNVGVGMGAPAKNGYVKAGLPIEVVSNSDMLYINQNGLYSGENPSNTNRIVGLVNSRQDTMLNAGGRSLYLGYSSTNKIRFYAPNMDYTNAGDITDMFCNNFITTGLTANQSRVTILSGGYMTIGKWAFVSIKLKMAAALTASRYYVMYGFPKPSWDSAVSVAARDKSSVMSGFMRVSSTSANKGELLIAMTSDLAVDDIITVSGIYPID